MFGHGSLSEQSFPWQKNSCGPGRILRLSSDPAFQFDLYVSHRQFTSFNAPVLDIRIGFSALGRRLEIVARPDVAGDSVSCRVFDLRERDVPDFCRSFFCLADSRQVAAKACRIDHSLCGSVLESRSLLRPLFLCDLDCLEAALWVTVRWCLRSIWSPHTFTI